jgi:transcriptional regulator with XRE-family HTH domain
MEARDRVKSARLAAVLTQRELAERAGISQSLVAQIERGEREPGRNALRSLAGALGTTVSRLLGERIATPGGDYVPPPELKKILADAQAPSGLSVLATDYSLVAILGITDAEWRALASIDLPGTVNRDRYVSLLFAMRAALNTRSANVKSNVKPT